MPSVSNKWLLVALAWPLAGGSCKPGPSPDASLAFGVLGRLVTGCDFPLCLQLMTEFLRGIRVIKFYAWEKHFSTRINACRAQELQKLRAIKYLDAVCVYLWAALPVVVSIVIFITYVLLGHQLTATKVSEGGDPESDTSEL